MRDLIESLTQQIVDHPDEVEVRELLKPGSVTYEIYVAEEDTGKVIGKGGRIINALRAVAKAAAAREGQRVFVELIA